MCNVIEVS